MNFNEERKVHVSKVHSNSFTSKALTAPYGGVRSEVSRGGLSFCFMLFLLGRLMLGHGSTCNSNYAAGVSGNRVV